QARVSTLETLVVMQVTAPDALPGTVTGQRSVTGGIQGILTCMRMEGAHEVIFERCNVNIRSEGGATDAQVNGLGNLIVGYDEAGSGPRTGSPNPVVGPFHAYSSNGGLVAGSENSVPGAYAPVSGGERNTASGGAGRSATSNF